MATPRTPDLCSCGRYHAIDNFPLTFLKHRAQPVADGFWQGNVEIILTPYEWEQIKQTLTCLTREKEM